MNPLGHMVSDMYSKWTTTGLLFMLVEVAAITAAVRKTKRRSGMVLLVQFPYFQYFTIF